MHNEFTAILERDAEWFVAYCPEIPGANGQGNSKDEALRGLSEAIELILEDRREDGLRGVPSEALREVRWFWCASIRRLAARFARHGLLWWFPTTRPAATTQ